MAAASQPPTGASQQLAQLFKARDIALADPTMYSQVIPVMVAVLLGQPPSPKPSQIVKVWGADFLAETFSSTMLGADVKQAFAISALPVFMDFLTLPENVQKTPVELTSMTKSIIQAVASVYPLVFRHIIRNPNDTETWRLMSAIKSNVLRRMDTELPGVRICCLRFVERIVQTQTPGVIADPRRPDQNEISLSLVPPDHPLIPPPNLEAEAQGLLDRALGILQEHHSDALLVTAVINGLGGLVRLRATIANRIITAILNFNPFRLTSSPMNTANKLMIKSMEKTTSIFLANLLKWAPQHPLAVRIEQHIIRLQQMRKDILDGTLKRPAVDEPTDGLDNAKRQRLGADLPSMPPAPLGQPQLPPGPISYAQLYTITNDPANQPFDVHVIPPELAARTLVHLLKFNISPDQLGHAINTVRSRFLSLTSRPTVVPAAGLPTPAPEVDDDDDDYEPDYQPTEDAEQLKNRLEIDAPEDAKLMKQVQSQGTVAAFRLPRAPPMTNEQIDMIALATIDRMFYTLNTLQASQEASERKRGFNEPIVRGAIDKNAYFRMIVRIAVRPLAGLETADQYRTAEGQINNETDIPIGDIVRQKLLQYILSDWNRRIGNAVTWFTEEWLTEEAVWKEYTKTLNTTNGNGGDVKPSPPPRHYQKWVLRFLEDLSVYLGGMKQDMKILIRFISELPALDREILGRVAGLAQDPERTTIVSNSLRYLVQYRPPAKELALDALQEIWKADKLPDGPNAKLLKSLRPKFMEEALEVIPKVETV
ncbi:hypothetical protein EJ08DRAFT_286859 [Tothia fuscella]|uniref:Symplekin/Pta1 N-terminal domain-containing protein n=1 Tax=Tothia fuscella TaxID=1048955 RepID=A0A9P4U456_9PEZI|nr:hypothetical protein EJ08DRAFT_286859 [Tothia fuscella]